MGIRRSSLPVASVPMAVTFLLPRMTAVPFCGGFKEELDTKPYNHCCHVNQNDHHVGFRCALINTDVILYQMWAKDVSSAGAREKEKK